jgi:hypothetical protein
MQGCAGIGHPGYRVIAFGGKLVPNADVRTLQSLLPA